MKIIPASALAAALVWSSACGRAAPPESSSPAAAHHHHAPHGGVLVELGNESAYVELVLNPEAATLTAYILDSEAEESVRLKQSSVQIAIETSGSTAAQVLDLPAHADILTGETVGDSSEFAATSPSLFGTKTITGHILDVLVKGQEFRDIRF